MLRQSEYHPRANHAGEVIMKLIYLYGPPASGKYTIARLVAERTGLPLFHNHLVVDAVAAVFPFGSESFIRLREKFWIDTIRAASAAQRSLIFTFQPEASVAPDFPTRVASGVSEAGGETHFVRLTLPLEEQLARIANTSRAQFGKLRDPALLRQLHEQFAACEEAMPEPVLTLNIATLSPEQSVDRIVGLVEGR